MTKAKALTEEQWLAGDEPYCMVRHLQQHCRLGRMVGGRRRVRLYACACCRNAWDLLGEEQRRVVEAAEQLADRKGSQQQLDVAMDAAAVAHRKFDAQLRPGVRHPPEVHGRRLIASAIEWITSTSPRMLTMEPTNLATALAVRHHSDGRESFQVAKHRADARHAELLRDVFHNPFRPLPALDSVWLAWKNGTVRQMAQAIYADRRWDDLPIFADALEEAGCGNVELLGHCRSALPHARGCWALDLLLGVA